MPTGCTEQGEITNVLKTGPVIELEKLPVHGSRFTSRTAVEPVT